MEEQNIKNDSSNKPQVLLFTSKTCPNCPIAKKFIIEFMKIRSDFNFIEYDTHTYEGQKKAEEFEIFKVPTFIILSKNLESPIGTIGTPSKDAMNKYLDSAKGLIKLEEKKGIIEKISSLFKS